MTIRTAVQAALVIGGAYALIMAAFKALAFAMIGTATRPEKQPVHAAMSWLRRQYKEKREYIARHARLMTDDDEEWHPLDEEAGDGQESKAQGQAASGPARPPSPHSDRAGPAFQPAADGATDGIGEHQDSRAAEDGDLTTGGDYDTDTLRIFHEENEQHHVRPHEPEVAEAASNIPETFQDHSDPSDPPGPDSAGGPSSGTPFAPVTTAACEADGLAVKADSTGPGELIADLRARLDDGRFLQALRDKALDGLTPAAYVDRLTRKLTAGVT